MRRGARVGGGQTPPLPTDRWTDRLTTFTVVWFLSTGAAGSLPLAAAGECGCSVIVTGGACVGRDAGSVALGAAAVAGVVVSTAGAAGAAGAAAGGCVLVGCVYQQ